MHFLMTIASLLSVIYNLNALEFFNTHYKNHPENFVSPSLLDFFETQVRSRLPESCTVLEIGSGNYSLFEEFKNLNARVSAVDFSKVAIEQAPKSSVKYYVKSLTDKSFFSKGEFDLVFDSHCVNCLVEEKDRFSAFENIHRVLKQDGLFAAELMVQPAGKKVEMPFKKIKTTHEIEDEIFNHKFKIVYFVISKENSFMNKVNGEEISCDVLRVIAKKESVRK